MFYVINLRSAMVEHESHNESECRTFIRNAQSLFNGTGPFAIVKGAANREATLRHSCMKSRTRF